MILLAILLSWLILAQFIMRYRMSDRRARKFFSERNIQVQIGTKESGPRSIHFVQTGNDSFPTLFFIHGSPGSWSVFKRYLADPVLLSEFRMIAIDRPGFGYSNYGKPLNLRKQAGLINSFLSGINNGKPIYLVGHSLGAPLVLKLAADNPTLVRGLLTMGGCFDPAKEKKAAWRPVVNYSPLRWFVPPGFRYSNMEMWWLRDDLEKLKEDLPHITCRSIIVHGERDGLVPVSNAGYANEMLQHSREKKIVLIPGGNHFIVYNKFDEIRELITSGFNSPH